MSTKLHWLLTVLFSQLLVLFFFYKYPFCKSLNINQITQNKQYHQISVSFVLPHAEKTLNSPYWEELLNSVGQHMHQIQNTTQPLFFFTDGIFCLTSLGLRQLLTACKVAQQTRNADLKHLQLMDGEVANTVKQIFLAMSFFVTCSR